MKETKNKPRVMARRFARELTEEETKFVAGGIGGGNTMGQNGAKDTNYN